MPAELELRFEVIQDAAGDPRVYGVELPVGWPIGTPFPTEARRVHVPVTAIRFKSDVGMADRLTLVTLKAQVRLVEPPAEVKGLGIFPVLEVVQEGERRDDVQSLLWTWDARDQEPKLLLGVLEIGGRNG